MKGTPIGGFFALELPTAKGGVHQFWSGKHPTACFVNARSALAALIAAERPQKVWLPAFLCSALADAVPTGLRRYYSVGSNLSPQVSALEEVRGGEMVVGIDYFGWLPSPDFLDFVSARPDVLFVEDCSHCLAPEEPGWGGWRLFSPRKLLGVVDGGILVAVGHGLQVPQPKQVNANSGSQWQAPLLRFEDEAQDYERLWHSANQAKEELMGVSDSAMTRLSCTLLQLIEPKPLIERRMANFLALEAELAPWMLPLRRRPGPAPFTFPLRLNESQRDPLLECLFSERIFAAVHWRDLPSPVECFPIEHQLAKELISLPCDHRYGADDMSRIVQTVLRALA